ncbi:MAG: hypothetical protein ACOY93_16025 [Bacillota bacterium]
MTSDLAAGLLQHLLDSGRGTSRFSVIGLAKNAGKTVTLNHIIRAAAARGLTLGLVSTGRDGEEKDAVTELPKPRIWAPAGAWLATAEQALEAGSAAVQVLRELPHATPFGRVVLGRVREPGEVLLIGPGSAGRIAEVLGALEACGTDLCLVDGSFDRMAAAAPAVTGRAVLAAGASYSSAMGETVAQVKHLLDLFDLPPVPAPLEPAVARAALLGPVSLVTPAGEATPVPVVSGLADPDAIAGAAAAAEAGSLLALTGALSDRLLQTLVSRRIFGIGLVVQDPTHILVGRHLWRRWRSQGGRAYAQHPVKLLAVTTNPHSPVGRDYDPQAFFEAIAAIADRPVFDLEAGLATLK